MLVPENSLTLNGGSIRSGGVDASLTHGEAAKSAGPALLPEGPTARFERQRAGRPSMHLDKLLIEAALDRRCCIACRFPFRTMPP